MATGWRDWKCRARDRRRAPNRFRAGWKPALYARLGCLTLRPLPATSSRPPLAAILDFDISKS